jgi:large subunit ribosomal protein L30
MLKITLKKSTIGTLPKQRKTVRALGLKKLNSCVEQPNNECVRGMINRVRHLIEVEDNES